MKIGLGIGIPFIRNYVSSIVFDPSKLFTGSTNGAWYDPSDITRYMSPLGPELVTNGDFSTDTVWTKGTGWSISGGVAVAASIPSGSNLTGANFSTVSGGRYIAKITVPSFSSGQVLFLAWNGSANIGQSSAITASGTYQFVFTANTASTLVYVSGAGGVSSTLTVDNISVRELTDISTATLYQDAAGTTPVTAVGQPVGLMLDKSKGLVLGPELAPSSTPDGAGWSSQLTVSVSGNQITFGSQFANRRFSFTSVEGRWYLYTFKARRISGNTSLRFFHENSATGVTTAFTITDSVQTYTIRFQGKTGGGAINVGIQDANTSGWGTIEAYDFSVKELPGNHAFNPSGNSANFPVLSARYNLLTKTEDFSDATWVVGAGAPYLSTVVFSGYVSGKRYQDSAGVSDIYFLQRYTYVPNINYTYSVLVKFDDDGNAPVFASAIGSSSQNSFILAVNGLITDPTTYSVFSLGSGLYRVSVVANSGAGSAQNTGIYKYATNQQRSFVTTAWDLRVSNDGVNLPAYQRVNTATDYDTVGFKPYLSFNGVNQWLQTNSIDFTYGDKMFVSAGVRKLSDAAIGVVAELSVSVGSNSGSFWLLAPRAPTPSYEFSSKGILAVTAPAISGYPAPTTSVLSGIGDISGDQAILRVNGTQVAISTADQGTGNYGNHPLYIGARAGTSLWFNGRLYGLVVAGKAASAGEITSCERYLNQKTGAWS